MQLEVPETVFPVLDVTPEQMAWYLSEGRRQRATAATAMARALWRLLCRRRPASAVTAQCQAAATPLHGAGRAI